MNIIPLHKHRFVAKVESIQKENDNAWRFNLSINQEKYVLFLSEIKPAENDQISFQAEYGIYHDFREEKTCKHCDEKGEGICRHLTERQYDVIREIHNLREALEEIV